jgi:Ternary complex associated domain 9
MTEFTVIDKALNAVFALFAEQSEPCLVLANALADEGFFVCVKTYIDDSESSLQDLAIAISSPPTYKPADPMPIPILIRMESTTIIKTHPYADLLSQLLTDKKLGVASSLHLIVPALLQYLNDNKKHEERLHTVMLEPTITKFQARIPDIQKSEDLKMATASLLYWAKLESLISAPTTPFCRLAGGIKPIVYVFDDYINFIDHEVDTLADPKIYKLSNEVGESDPSSKRKFYCKISDAEGALKTELCSTITKFYSDTSSSQTESLIEPLLGFAGCLNNLSVVFDVKAKKMGFKPPETNNINYFQLVAGILDFPESDKTRNQIAAFIVDLEWLPSPEWIKDTINAKSKWPKLPNNDQMGYYAVRLLTQRYPEIPCFVFTGMWKTEILQKSLAAGAAWCFRKPMTHHLGNESLPGEELNYFSLDYHLTEFAHRTYGTYSQLPNSSQFNMESSDQAVVDKLNKKIAKTEEIEIDLRDENNDLTIVLRKLIASQFTADKVNPIKVLSGGKSGALSTFFVQPIDNSEKEATRFVKIDSWLNAQTEYFAYHHIIRPRLNNHVAHIIQKPSVIKANTKSSNLLGAITSSLAGFPEDYSKLSTLQEVIDKYVDQPNGARVISEKIQETFKFVLLPLYQNNFRKEYWLGEEFMFRYEGRIVPIKQLTINDSVDVVNHLKRDDINKMIEELDERAGKDAFCLQGWSIQSINKKRAGLILYHSVLGCQIALKTEIQELNRFNALWIKPKTSVKFIIELQSIAGLYLRFQKEILEKSLCLFNDIVTFTDTSDREGIEIAIQSLINKWIESNKIFLSEDLAILNPFKLLSSKEQKVMMGTASVIHGDLNLNNILYPEGEKVGFLIDFAKTKKNGLIAFDISWLEVHFWNRYIFPEILVVFSPESNQSLTSNQVLFLCIELINNGNQKGVYSRVVRSTSSSLHNSLKVIESIREFAKKNLTTITLEEQYYCLGVSFLKYSKFEWSDEIDEISSKVNVLSFLAAAYYLSAMSRCDSVEI